MRRQNYCVLIVLVLLLGNKSDNKHKQYNLIMKRFFKSFFKKHKAGIIWFSFMRMISFVQVLFWPFAFAKIINIITGTPEQWQKALLWVGLMIVNKISEDVVRLRSKLGLEKIAAKLSISLATFFMENTEIKKGIKTGEAVQTIKQASDAIGSIVTYYKDSMLQLPVNFIFIPMILFNIGSNYLAILIIYVALYFLIDYFAASLYSAKLQKYFEADGTFWGTTYRKAPEIWRARDNGILFSKQIEEEGQSLYKDIASAITTNNWRWIFLQGLSSTSVGIAVLFVFFKILKGVAHIGDLVLISDYFQQTQGSLNIVSSSISQIIQTRIALERLNEAVEVK